MAASERMPPQSLNIANKPRPSSLPIPSRTSSLNSASFSPLSEHANCNSIVGSANANTTAETAALSWGRPAISHRQSLMNNESKLQFLNIDPTRGQLRCSSSRPSSGGNCRTSRRSASCSATTRNPMRATKVQRWAGLTRTTSEWDGLRRDPELWFEDGDCLVHLYARGQSRRGPSFCVPFKALRRNKCGAMFSLCFAQISATSGANGQNPKRVSSGLSTPIPGSNKVELFIPAPEDAAREASFHWHITTRNFFAFVFGRPLVGTHMGQALVDLQERMHLFRSGQIDNQKDFLEYAENQGYRDFVECPDYALAILYYAEHYKLRDVWIDAFAHCVGMNESLALSSEFPPLSRLTKALVTRAYLEMDIQLGRVSSAVRNFLEDDLSPAYLGLTDGARAHLDRFRSFLHSFYVEKFGYWPPPKGASFSKALYKSMYFDFKTLYDYLVDRESTTDLSLQKPASGGICTLQNVVSFDKRHKFPPLPHPLPLLPSEVPVRKRIESQKALRALTLGSKQAKTDRYLTARAALTTATNCQDISATSSVIVQAYIRFERQCALNQREEKVSMADARKVRWLLIYGTLQYLISALRAPKEVRDTEGPLYPLCCLVTEQSPWQLGTKALVSPVTHSINVPEAINTYLSESSCPVPEQLTPGAPMALTIQPDCQTDDYFAHTNRDASSRPVSVEVPAPLRVSQPSRNPSVRSFRRLSLSSRTSRRNSVVLKTQAHCEILVHGYGNGLNATIIDPPSQPVSQVQSRRPSLSLRQPERSSGYSLPEGNGPETSWLRPSTPDACSRTRRPVSLEINCNVIPEPSRTPIVDCFHMDQILTPAAADGPTTAQSCSDSTTSTQSRFWSDGGSPASSKSSTHDDAQEEPLERKTTAAEESGLLGGLVPIDTTPIASPKRTPRSSRPTTPATPSKRGEFRFSFDKHTSPSRESSQASPASTGADSAIGVALSPPATPPKHIPIASLSFDTLPLPNRPRPLSRSFSVESIQRLKQMDPMRSGPMPALVPTTEAVIDIFSALSLPPRGPEANAKEAYGHAALDTARSSALDAVPPPIAKTRPTKPLKLGFVVGGDDAERGRKKEKRKSFWRR